MSIVSSETNNFPQVDATHICIGFSELCNSEHRANALIDNFYLTTTYEEDTNKFIDGDIKDSLVYLSFNGSVSNFDNTTVELTPSNKNQAPVILEKADGTLMTRVSFSDPNNGKYVPYAVQKVKCAQSNVFELYFDNIELDKFKPFAYDANNNAINVVSITKNKATLDFEPKSKYGQELTIVYQPRNSFVVENLDNDVFKIQLGKHDGQPFKITYETEEDNVVKLINNIDLNAVNNPQHDGFIYLTDSVYNVDTLDCTIYPKEIRADGKQKAIIIVDCKDENGSIVTDALLTLNAEHGTIKVPVQHDTIVPLQQQAGRHIYEYTPPIVNASYDGYIIDNIKIEARQNNELRLSMRTSIKLYSV